MYNQYQNDRSYTLKILPTLYLPGVLKTGLSEILSQVQHVAGNLSNHNLLKSDRDAFSVKKNLPLQY